MPKSNSDERVYSMSTIKLDSAGAVPTRVLLMHSGNWPNSIKGNFSISVDDLKQIKQNFDAGIGFPTEDASTGIPIDFKHEYLDEAAGWIKGLELHVDDDNQTAQLYADPIEWSDKGAEAVQNGRFKGISASGGFGKKGERLGAWQNPTNLKQIIRNVLDGAGLTNIPFLRGMSPIRASATDDGLDNEIESGKVIFISDSQQKNKEPLMQLDAVRVKEADALSADEKQFILEKAAELSPEELTKFGIKTTFSVEGEEANKDEDGNKIDLSAEDKALLTDENKEILAAINSGSKKLVDTKEVDDSKTELAALRETADQYRTEKAEAVVKLHVERGAIKQDSAPFWTKQLLNADKDGRTALEEQLSALPENKLLAEEVGSAEDVNAGSTGRDQLSAIANKKVAEASKAGKELLFSDALKQAIRENSGLAEQDAIEQKVKVGA